MASLDDLVQPLRSVAAEAAVTQLRQAYLESARRFFTGSWGWREFVTSTVDAGNNDRYTLAPPVNDTEVFRIDAVWHDGKRLAHFATKTMNMGNNTTGDPTSYRDGPPNLVVVSPEPAADIASALSVLGVIRPTVDATTMNDEVVSHFGEDLLNGARWHLFAMVADWQNLETAEYYRKLFQTRVEQVRRYAIQGEYFQYFA